MSRRFIKIQNFKNIGVTKNSEEYQTLYLNNTLNKDEMGGLIIVIGENNVGKSNILDALTKIKPVENIDLIDLKNSTPNFMDYEEVLPRIKLVYADDESSPEIEYYLDENNNVQIYSNLETEIKKVKTVKKVKNAVFDTEELLKEFKDKLFNLFKEERKEFRKKMQFMKMHLQK